MIKQIAHVCFGTSDLDKTVEFYGRCFGSKILHEFRDPKGDLYGVFISISENCNLEFFRVSESIQPGTLFRHLCLEVDDIEAIKLVLSEKGIATEIKRGRTDLTLQCWVEDPNGIRIEFHQYDSQSRLRKSL